MSAASLPIASSMPAEYNVDDPQTSSAFVLRRNYVELLPNEQIVFQPQSGQDMIRFIINDQSSFFVAPNSYFRFQFRAGNANLTTGTQAQRTVKGLRLGHIGIDSLFRMVELRSVASGTVLMRQNFYNHGVAAQQYYFRPDEYAIGDGYDARSLYKQPRICNKMVRIHSGAAHTIATGTPATSSATPNAGISGDQQVVITFNDVNAIGLINVGDIVEFEMKTWERPGMSNTAVAPTQASEAPYVSSGSSYTGISAYDGAVFILQTHKYKVRVTLVAQAAAVATVTGDVVCGPDVVNGTIYHAAVEQRNEHPTQASYICDGQWHTVCWQPINSVFWQNWPLFLLKGGLELVLYLENPNVALVRGVQPRDALYDNTATTPLVTTMTYQIQTPRLVALMSTPEPSIQRDFIGKWNSDQGIVYYCPQLETRKMQGNASDNNMVLNVPFGKRSIRYVMFNIIPSNIANGNGALGLVHDAFRSNIRSHLRYLWVQVAANYFPARRIETDDEANEILWQSKNTLALPFSTNNVLDMEKYQHKRYENADCYYWTGATGMHLDASGAAAVLLKKFETRDRIYAINFARTDGKGGILSGIDGSISSVDLLIDRNGKGYSDAYIIDESRTGEVNALADTGEAQWADTPVYMIHGYHDHFIRLAAMGLLVLN